MISLYCFLIWSYWNHIEKFTQKPVLNLGISGSGPLKKLAIFKFAILFVIATFNFANAKDLLNVIGNVSVTTQFKTLQKPFWTEKVPDASGGDIKVNFKGWMFASSPALAAMEHPVYDVWVVDCINNKIELPQKSA